MNSKCFWKDVVKGERLYGEKLQFMNEKSVRLTVGKDHIRETNKE